MKKSYFFKNKVKSIICFAVFSMFLFVSSCYAQMYYYYPTGGGTITSSGGNVFNVGTGTQLTVNVPMCITGNTNPKNATNFNLSWYVNTVNSNTGGTFVSGGTQSTGTNFNALYSLAISNSTPGVYYYYAVSNGGNASVCSGTNSMTSSVFQVTVNGPATHLNFDGTNDVVTVPNSASLAFGTSNLTLEAMVKMSNPQGNYSGIITKATTGTFVGIQLVVVNNKLALEFGNGTLYGVGFGLIGTTNLNDNNWHHVSCVVDRTNNNIKLYVDGISEANITNAVFGTVNITTTTPLFIGQERYSNAFLESNIDEVRIWNTARTAEQINGSKNCELQGNETGLVANYKFNQGIDAAVNTAITSLIDATANGNNGTLVNFTKTGTTSNFLAGSPVATGNTCTVLQNESFNVSTNFKIYPNPTKNIVNIDVLNLDNALVEVYDINGRQLFTQKLNNTTNNVNIENLAAGVYMFKVTSNQGTATSKVIKQ